MFINKNKDQNNYQYSNSGFELINQLSIKRIPFFFVINFEKDDIRVYPLPVDANQLMFDFPNMANYDQIESSTSVDLKVGDMDFESYNLKFQKIKKEI